MGAAQTPSPVLNDHVSEISNYTVALLGTQGVGKTALISQFMTSECINAYERQKGKYIFHYEVYCVRSFYYVLW